GALLSRCDVLLSICPPHAAVEAAAAAAGFDGLYVDANAVSPDTVGAVQAAVGGRFVAGGGIGAAPGEGRATRPEVGRGEAAAGGDGAPAVGGLLAGGPLEAIALDGDVGAASALKMTCAAWTKGTAALLVAIRATAQAHGVDDELLAEWAISQPRLADRYERA